MSSQDSFSSRRSGGSTAGTMSSHRNTSPALTQGFYKRAEDIVALVGQMLDRELDIDLRVQRNCPHDVPGQWFKGPF